jgi:anti-sigma-K factor RskA
MGKPILEQSEARRFLLGYLQEGDRQTVEERLTVDPEYLEFVLQTESELMEDYVDGQLSNDERRRFEEHVLTNQHQIDQLKLTRALGASARVRAAAHSPPVVERTRQVGPLRFRRTDALIVEIWGIEISAAVIIIIAVLCAGAFFLIWRNYHSENNNLRASLTEELVKLNAQQNLNAMNNGFIIGPLKGGLVRDEETKSFTIPSREHLVQLRLQVGAGDYQGFQAVLQTAEGREIFTLGDLKATSISGVRIVVIYLPAKVLSPEDYQLRLSGVTQNSQLVYVGRYVFRIVGK